MKILVCSCILVLVAACGQVEPTPAGGVSSAPAATAPPAAGGDQPAQSSSKTPDDAPLFYSTIYVGSDRSDVPDEVRAHVEVRAYGSIRPGEIIALGVGERLTINDVPLVQREGSLDYDARHVPEDANGKYQFKWIRPAGALGFEPVHVPRLTVSIPATLRAGAAVEVMTTPVVDHFGWDTAAACAKKTSQDSGFENAGSGAVLSLLRSPCQADIGVTSETMWDAAFVDLVSGAVVGRGHVSIDARSLAWQSVTVLP